MDAVEREYNYMIKRYEEAGRDDDVALLKTRLEEYQILEKGEREAPVPALD